MPSRPQCTACARSTSTPRNFLLVCACGSAWHHRCTDPQVEQHALLAMIIAFNRGVFAESINAWRCKQCATGAGESELPSVGDSLVDVFRSGSGRVGVKQVNENGKSGKRDGFSSTRRFAPFSPRPVWPPVRRKKRTQEDIQEDSEYRPKRKKPMPERVDSPPPPGQMSRRVFRPAASQSTRHVPPIIAPKVTPLVSPSPHVISTPCPLPKKLRRIQAPAPPQIAHVTRRRYAPSAAPIPAPSPSRLPPRLPPSSVSPFVSSSPPIDPPPSPRHTPPSRQPSAPIVPVSAPPPLDTFITPPPSIHTPPLIDLHRALLQKHSNMSLRSNGSSSRNGHIESPPSKRQKIERQQSDPAVDTKERVVDHKLDPDRNSPEEQAGRAEEFTIHESLVNPLPLPNNALLEHTCSTELESTGEVGKAKTMPTPETDPLSTSTEGAKPLLGREEIVTAPLSLAHKPNAHPSISTQSHAPVLAKWFNGALTGPSRQTGPRRRKKPIARMRPGGEEWSFIAR